jgi:hypothetical protein
MGQFGLLQGLAHAGLRQAKLLRAMIPRQLLASAVFALTQGHDAPPDRRHMLADGAVDAVNAGGSEGPVVGGQHRLDGSESAEHHVRTDADQAPPARDLDHLGVEPRRQRHPTRLGHGAFGLTALRLPPLPEMGQHRPRGLHEAVGQEEGHTARGQHLDDLLDDALGHGQRPVPDGDGQSPLGDQLNRHPPPVRRARQALESLGLAELTVLDRPEQGLECLELHRRDAHVVQNLRREGLELVRGLA